MRIRKSPSAGELEGLARELLGELRELSERAPNVGAEPEAIECGRLDSAGVFAENAEHRAAAGFGFETDGSVLLKGAAMAAESADGRELFYDADWQPVRSRADFRAELLRGENRTPRRAERGRGAEKAYGTRSEDTHMMREIRTQTAESLSEAFCRDARRYDGAFEKY